MKGKFIKDIVSISKMEKDDMCNTTELFYPDVSKLREILEKMLFVNNFKANVTLSSKGTIVSQQHDIYIKPFNVDNKTIIDIYISMPKIDNKDDINGMVIWINEGSSNGLLPLLFTNSFNINTVNELSIITKSVIFDMGNIEDIISNQNKLLNSIYSKTINIDNKVDYEIGDIVYINGNKTQYIIVDIINDSNITGVFAINKLNIFRYISSNDSMYIEYFIDPTVEIVSKSRFKISQKSIYQFEQI